MNIAEKGQRHLNITLALLLTVTILFAGCSADVGEATSGSASEVSQESSSATGVIKAQSANMDFSYPDRDQDASYDESTATRIELSDEGSLIDGDGASVKGSVVSITEEGTYLVSGSLSNGLLVVETTDDVKVQVVLDGVTIHNETGPAFLVEDTDKIFVTLADGSENTLSDGASHEMSHDDNDHNAVIYSHSDISFNGSGTLQINAGYKHGIVSRDDLIITGGNYVISAPGDALKGKDCVKILDGSFELKAGSDGIQSHNSSDETRGFVSIDGGSFVIDCDHDGIQAETVLRIVGGDFEITTADGATQIISSESQGGFAGRPEGGRFMGDQQDKRDRTKIEGEGKFEGEHKVESMLEEEQQDEDSADSTSYKGLKAGSAIEIEGGTFAIDAVDDAIHSDNTVYMSAGTFELISDDDAIHADGDLVIDDAYINIINCYEGIEGSHVYINGGEIYIKAVDDGINAASDTSSNYTIQITGGFVYVDADSDALDSNNSLGVSGGTLVASGAVAGDGNGLDADGVMLVEGGYVAAAVQTTMAAQFSADSSQASCMYNASIAAQTPVSLVDSDGNVIMTFESPKAYTCLILSAPEMTVGETYSLYAGASLSDEAQSGFSLGGSIEGAELLAEFTQSEISVSLSSSGEVSSAPRTGGPPDGMGMGRR